MTTPLTTELPQHLEPVTHDGFIDNLPLLVPIDQLVRALHSADRREEWAGSHA